MVMIFYSQCEFTTHAAGLSVRVPWQQGGPEDEPAEEKTRKEVQHNGCNFYEAIT